MSIEHDQQLSTFFEDANTDLSSKAFTQRVMFDVHKENQRKAFLWVARCIAIIAIMWTLSPFIQKVSQIIATLPGDGMVLLTESLQPLSTFPLTYFLALPFGIYALFIKFMEFKV